MSLRKLKELTKQLNEGLNKKQYNDILKDVLIGVEIEVVTEDTYSDGVYEVEIDIDALPSVTRIRDSIHDFNTTVDNYNDGDLGDKVLEETGNLSELPEFDEVYICNPSVLADYVEEEFNKMYSNSEDIVTDMENNIGIILEKETDFFLPLLNADHQNEQDAEEIKEGIISDMEEISSDLEYSSHRIKEQGSILYRECETFAMELFDSNENSFEDMKNAVEEEISTLLDDMTDPDVSIGGWRIVEDGSLSGEGLEIVTPAVTYNTFLEFVPKIISGLKGINFHGGDRCGYHIGLSSESINIKELIKENYKYYQSLGFNKLTSLMVATQQGYKAVYRHNDEGRGEYTTYARSLVAQLGGIDPNTTLEDILYGDLFDYTVEHFMQGIKYSNTNLSKANYIELRTLGGAEGFEILGDVAKLKVFLYDAISQVFGGVVKLEKREVIKFMRSLLRDVEEYKAPSGVDKKDKFMSVKAAAIARKILEEKGDKVLNNKTVFGKKADYYNSITSVLGNDYTIEVVSLKLNNEIQVRIIDAENNDLHYSAKYDEKTKISEIVKDFLEKLDKLK